LTAPGAGSPVRGRPHAMVLLTGDELLQGRVRDTNGPFLTAGLIHGGYVVESLQVLPDDRSRIVAAVRAALAREVRVLVVSGGLGTTHDDVTMAAVAEATGRPLEYNESAWQLVKARIDEIARRRELQAADLYEQAARQAYLPQGARCLPPAGVAPGAVLDAAVTTIIVLPGPPRELEAMWPPVLAEVSGETAAPSVQLLRLWGVGEMAVVPVLEEAPHDALDVGVTAADGEIVVRLAWHDAVGATQAGGVAAALAAALPVFSNDGRTLDELVAEGLLERCATLAVAESCTGGLLGGRVTARAGSSDYFLGGVLSYANDVKENVLGVPAALLARYGAVSEQVAAAMAEGVKRLLGADFALSVTGVAGPSGGSAEKPVGLVFIGCASPDGVVVKEHRLVGDRDSVRHQAVTAALHLLRRSLGIGP
jgi:nicotinamide-nucleotide amidase